MFPYLFYLQHDTDSIYSKSFFCGQAGCLENNQVSVIKSKLPWTCGMALRKKT